MSVTEITQELAALPEAERLKALRTTLHQIYPQADTAVARLLRRLEHPDVPEEFWEGLEQAEDGKTLDVRDEHFERPPA